MGVAPILRKPQALEKAVLSVGERSGTSSRGERGLSRRKAWAVKQGHGLDPGDRET